MKASFCLRRGGWRLVMASAFQLIGHSVRCSVGRRKATRKESTCATWMRLREAHQGVLQSFTLGRSQLVVSSGWCVGETLRPRSLTERRVSNRSPRLHRKGKSPPGDAPRRGCSFLGATRRGSRPASRSLSGTAARRLPRRRSRSPRGFRRTRDRRCPRIRRGRCPRCRRP